MNEFWNLEMGDFLEIDCIAIIVWRTSGITPKASLFSWATYGETSDTSLSGLLCFQVETHKLIPFPRIVLGLTTRVLNNF
jgi:hypothetical protein